jgi:UDP-glucose 4-epimerase
MGEAKTVLVTGGAGFIGTIVTRQLLERGWRVRILDNFYRPDRTRLDALRSAAALEIIEGDVRYRAAVDRAMAGVDRVVHLAALCINKSIADPTESFEVNLLGSQHVFESAAEHRVARVVFASSASVYGDPKRLPMRETDAPDPRTPYCISKLAGEQALRFYAERRQLSWMALRFFNVYGPGQQTDAYYTSVILTFLRRLARGEAPAIDGDGAQSMDFIHVEDVARAVVLAVEAGSSGEVLNVGSGTQTTIADLARVLIAHMGVDIQPEFRPRPVLVSRRCADVTRIREVLGWTPTIDVELGLRTVVEHLRSSGDLAAAPAGAPQAAAVAASQLVGRR